MADYIKREDALSVAHKIGKKEYDWGNVSNAAIVMVVEGYLRAVPTADVRPVVRGKWNRTDAYPHRLYCSVCYKTYLKNDELLERWEFPLNFCPNCGADMRGAPNGV